MKDYHAVCDYILMHYCFPAMKVLNTFKLLVNSLFPDLMLKCRLQVIQSDISLNYSLLVRFPYLPSEPALESCCMIAMKNVS